LSVHRLLQPFKFAVSHWSRAQGFVADVLNATTLEKIGDNEVSEVGGFMATAVSFSDEERKIIVQQLCLYLLCWGEGKPDSPIPHQV